MASTIDAFVTTLGLDGTLFRRGMDDAERTRRRFDETTNRSDRDRERQERLTADARRKRHQQEESRTKATVEGYKKIRNGLLGMAAVFTAGVGIKTFIQDTINGAVGLGYLSQNLKQTTQELTSWQRASERAGGSAGGIIAQMKESADTLAQLKSGMGPNEGLQSFFRWGGKADELKDGNTYLLARSRIIHELFKTDPAQAALISKSMGISDEQFDFLKQGPDAVMALVAAQEKNSVITAKNAEDALSLKNKMLDLRDSLQSTAVRVLTALLPSLTKLGDWLLKITDYVANNKDVIAAWIERFINADWSGVTSQAKDFAKSVGDIAEGLKEVLMLYKEWTGGKGSKDMIPNNLDGWVSKLGILKDGSQDAGKSGLLQSLKTGAARTLASFGNKTAGEYVRDKTGRDDYRVGPKQVDKSVMAKLMAQGWTHEQAAGIAGSLQQESGMNPAARNPKSGAYGIAQWLSKDRVANFKKVMGRDLVGSTLDQQLEFQHYEMTKGSEQPAGRKLRAATTAEDAARIHSQYYERPDAKEANIGRRQRLAAQYAAEGRTSNARAAGALPAGSAASVAMHSKTSTSTNTTNIEKIEVHTQATDAPGIAAAMRPAVEKYMYTAQANTGFK